MYITNMGQVQASVQELLGLRLKHLYSAVDPEPSGTPPQQRCGTITTLSGYTEWVGDTHLPISLGWDWRIQIHAQAGQWQRDELPRTNMQLVNEHGHPLPWEDNLRMLATWVDAQDWQNTVTNALR
ncbi:MAG: DUF4902 domain-containing protein, partial [Giesbergeria sp.]